MLTLKLNIIPSYINTQTNLMVSWTHTNPGLDKINVKTVYKMKAIKYPLMQSEDFSLVLNEHFVYNNV